MTPELIAILGVGVAGLSMAGMLITLMLRMERRLEQRIDRVEDRFDRRFDGVESRFDRVDERFDRLEERLQRLEQGQSRIEGELSIIREFLFARPAAGD